MEDFEQQLQELVALESVIEQLDALQEQVESEGMSKEVALEAQKLIPGFNNNRPLAYYDARPSFVAEYKTSLESMQVAAAIAFVAACAAIGALIGRFLSYLMGGSSGGGGGGGSVGSGTSSTSFKFHYTYGGKKYDSWEKANEARQKDMKEHAEKMYESAFKNQSSSSHSSQSSHSHTAGSAPKQPLNAMLDLDKLIEAEIKVKGNDSPIGRILLAEDFFSHDFITNGPYSSTMVRMLEVAPNMRKSLTALQGEIASLTRDYPYVMENPEPEKNIRTELMERLPLAYKSQGKFRNTEWKIGNSVKQMDDSKAEAQSKASNHRFKYSELVKKVEAIVARLPVVKIIEIFKDCEDDLAELEVKLRKLTEGMDKYKDRKDLSDFQQEYQGEAQSALNNLRSDVVGTIRFMNHLDQFGRNVRRLENRIQKMQVEAVRLISQVAKDNGTLTPEMKKLEKEMLDNLTIDM